jgi:hypothetical protein
MRSILVSAASFFVAISSSDSDARPLRHPVGVPECNVIMPCDFSGSQTGAARTWYRRDHIARNAFSARAEMVVQDGDRGQIVGGRPAGCPHSFCGCGAAIRVFGHIVPELNLAANWLRFPRTAPAPGMVAARRGHVFVLEQQLQGDVWMAYDANSGGRATRLHARSLRGYTVVNPRAA